MGIETSVIPVCWTNLESRPLAAVLLGPGQPRQNNRPPSAVIYTLLAMSGLTPTTKERFCWLTEWVPFPNYSYQRSAITRAPLEGVPSQQAPSQSRLCVIVQRPILLSCSDPRVVTRQPSVSDALIHAKTLGWCCHALTCRFYFPPCLPAMLIRPENGHSY